MKSLLVASVVALVVATGEVKACSVDDYWAINSPRKEWVMPPGVGFYIDQRMMACDDWNPYWFVVTPRTSRLKLDRTKRVVKMFVPSKAICLATKKHFAQEAVDSSRDPTDKYAKTTCEKYFFPGEHYNGDD